jgi:hypothetical protein
VAERTFCDNDLCADSGPEGLMQQHFPDLQPMLEVYGSNLGRVTDSSEKAS